MSSMSMTEEEAKILFATQINALAEHARGLGPDPDCARLVAEIIAENETECSVMERRIEAEEAEERAHRLAAGA